jgi:ATP-dependent helicase HrpB
MANLPPQLPIDGVLPELVATLSRQNRLVLSAAPGAGKTTRVPLALLEASWRNGKKIIMLEPRRLAATAAAAYMAEQLGSPLGEIVGYRIRGDTKISSRTVIEVVTEGVLTRILEEDPELPNIGLLIFDEFHERGINSDVGLALALEVQESLRPDLKIIVMSATLDIEGVARLLKNAPVITAPGRNFPVGIKYLEPIAGEKIEFEIARAVKTALLDEPEGDILVFLPGRAEIQRTAMRLESLPNCIITPLYSDVGERAQQTALGKPPQGKRKIILATSIAETSITIDGVRVVIDSGLMRVPRYDQRRALSSLETVSVSQGAAEQRRGRAGRVAPGLCYRLWKESAHAALPRHTTPEILQADLVPLVLELALWGAKDLERFSFLDKPPPREIEQARSVLESLGAVRSTGEITPHGKAMHELGVHPRIAHMLIKARDLGIGALACDIAALLEERDILGSRAHDASVFERWYELEQFRTRRTARLVSHNILERLTYQAQRLRSLLRVQDTARDENSIGLLIALIFPDRIAKQREKGSFRYHLRNGIGGELPAKSLLTKHEFLAVAELDGSRAHAKIFLAEPLSERDLIEHFGSSTTKTRTSFIERSSNIIRARTQEFLGEILLSEHPTQPTTEEIQDARKKQILEEGFDALVNDTTRRLLQRIAWIESSGITHTFPSMDLVTLRQECADWLIPYCTSPNEVPLYDALVQRLTRKGLDELQRLAPERITLPSGTSALIDYEKEPSVSAPLQELLGQRETPKIGDGRVALVVELLSPARRPLQVTKDLASFWKNAYKQVRAEMMSRYPRHYWPENPLEAAPMQKSMRSGLKKHK